mmetsp:Transcript_14894/g.24544  ORF Transcript_14894/g.24544 Transcript_14894/m.24544 type:complete len:565 (-) Transcript_14894:181-1875(-)
MKMGAVGASSFQTWTASGIFLLTWILITANRVPFLPIGRPSGAVLGAMLMIAVRVLTIEEAYSAVDGNTIVLLFGMMVITARLEKEGLFDYLAHHVLKGCKNGFGLLWRISVTAAVLAAFLTNDTVCVFMTPMVITACTISKVPMGPYLIALATSANIGSAATPTGNPQNMIIHSKSDLSFIGFVVHIGLTSVVGMAINMGVIFVVNRTALLQPFSSASNGQNRLTSGQPIERDEEMTLHNNIGGEKANGKAHYALVIGDDDGRMSRDGRPNVVQADTQPSYMRPPASKDHCSDQGSGDGIVLRHSEPSAPSGRISRPLYPESPKPETPLSITLPDSHRLLSVNAPEPSPLETDKPPLCGDNVAREGGKRALFRRLAMAAVILGVIVGFLVGLDLPWTALGGAWLLIILDFKDPAPLFAMVDWSLLLFFAGLFIVVHGWGATGIPVAAWDFFRSMVDLHTAAGLAVYSFLILVASNIVSNVPTVLIISPLMESFGADAERGWYLLAFISTVAGNLTLIGSVANIIVAQRAREHYVIGFVEYCKVGVPSTLLVVLAGVCIMSLTT